MRTLALPPGKSPRDWGRIHGESFRGEVKALAAIRAYLCTKIGGFSDRAQVIAAAAAHLPVLERYHAGLYAELLGIAEGAACTPEEIVIANHYTDLRDLDPDPSTWRAAPTHDDAGGARSHGRCERPRWRRLQRDLGGVAEWTRARADLGHARDRDSRT